MNVFPRYRPCPFATLTALALVAVVGLACEPQAEQPPPFVVSWTPTRPLQGHLFVIRVAAPPDSAAVSLTGEAGGEVLRFTRDGTEFASLAPVPIGIRDTVTAWVQASYEDGRTYLDSLRIPVTPGEYAHERLTVAPRFGSRPNAADQAQLQQDREKAARVAREAHATPKLWTDAMIMPRSSRVTSEFGTGREFNGQISSRHMGLDLRGFTGDTILAPAVGVVALADGFLFAGNVVYINHGGGLLSGYFHLSKHLVAEGDTVAPGTPIGLAGATGRVTGPHLHWVARYGTTTVDPRSMLTARERPPFQVVAPVSDGGGADSVRFAVPGDTAIVAGASGAPVAAADWRSLVGPVADGLGLGDGPVSVVVPSPGRHALIGGVDGAVSVVDIEAQAVVQVFRLTGATRAEADDGEAPSRAVSLGLHFDGNRVFVASEIGEMVALSARRQVAADTPDA